MNLAKSSIIAAAGLISLAAFFPTAGAAQEFKVSDLRGDYAFKFQGTLLQNGNPVPIAAVGVLTLDGQGRVTKATRFLNVAGMIVRQTATGTYTVNADGTGTSAFDVVPAAGQPAFFPPTREVFQFTLVSRSRGFGLTGAVRAANGDDIGLLTIAAVEFVRQVP